MCYDGIKLSINDVIVSQKGSNGDGMCSNVRTTYTSLYEKDSKQNCQETSNDYIAGNCSF